MPLPKLNNDTPRYEMTIPSTKESVMFRPFLVKEQKTLLVAFESQDQKLILSSLLGCLETCVPGINVKDLATFDVDYMFTQVRSKSVGESTTLLSACTECNEENEVKIKLDDIKLSEIKNDINGKVVPLTDDISVELKYPTYNDLIRNTTLKDGSNKADVLFESIVSCLKAVQTQEENIVLRDEPKEEVETFVNSLTSEQLEKITNYVQDLPTLTHVQKFTCKKRGKENEARFEGLQDFF